MPRLQLWFRTVKLQKYFIKKFPLRHSGYRLRGSGYEEFYVVNGKVELDTMIKIHIRAEKK